MPQNLNDDKSTLVQVMAWWRQATSHYLNQWWPRSPMPYGVTRPQWVNICYCQHSPEIESSSKFEWIYHDPMATRCINCEISKLICFLFSFLPIFIHHLFPYPLHFLPQHPWAKITERGVCLWRSLANPFTERAQSVTTKWMQVTGGQLV